ncbi:MAG: MarC family protein [Patescibacteria group bacterium]|nr:hypothetical protein [Patescibacteria group bacterium]
MDINQFVLFVIGLLAIFSPAASISVFANSTKGFSRDIQKTMALRITLFYLLIILVMAWGGQIILKVLGISVESLQVVGGLLLIIAGLPLCINYGTSDAQAQILKSKDWKNILMVPLTFPITVGGAGISYVIITMQESTGLTDSLLITLGILITGFLIWLTYYFAGPISSKLGPGATDIFSKIAGIILMALGVTILAAGVTTLFPGLA